MRFQFLFSFALRLLQSKKWQYGISSFGIFLGLTSLFLFLGLSFGIKNFVEKELFQHKDILTIRPLPQKFSFLGVSLNTSLYTKIQNMEGVSAVYKESSLVIPSFAKSNLLLNFPVDVAFIHGLEKEMFLQEAQIEFPQDGDTIPVLISPFALDFLNSIAGQIPGFSGFSSQKLIGKKIDLTFGKSAFIPFPKRKKIIKYKAQIVGVTDLAPVVGLTFLQSDMVSIANQMEENIEGKYLLFHVQVSHPQYLSVLQKKFENMGLFVQSQNASAERLSVFLVFFLGILFLFSGILLLLSFLFLFSTISISVLEQVKTIGIFRSLGACTKDIQKIFYIQGFIIVLGSSIIALVGSFFLMEYISEYLQLFTKEYSFFPNEFFLLPPFAIIIVFGGVLLAGGIAVFIPLWQILRKDPMVSLLE